MKELCSFPQPVGSLTNLTTDGSIFWVRGYNCNSFGKSETLLYDWKMGHEDETTSIPDGVSHDLSFPIDLNRGLFLQRRRLRLGGIGPLVLYQVIRTEPHEYGIGVEEVVLSGTPARIFQSDWNFSYDGRHIVNFNIQTKPMVETWTFKEDLATEGHVSEKVGRAEKHSFTLKPHTHRNSKSCNCLVSSVSMAENIVVVISFVLEPHRVGVEQRVVEEYFATGWSLNTRNVVFQHTLGTWNVESGFHPEVSHDCKILKLSRRATSEEEEQWRKFRDFRRAYLHSTFELDGPNLRVNRLLKDIGRTFFMSMVEPAEGNELSSWVFDFVLNLRRLDES
ncbi:hypothetical protein N0V84_000688 [Fusarium piperis]|uniref:Uncharacterized protein n=1 Tax=Fusarium piperis TaxID=1435070 RepID=A0A9W8WMI7_9HYPO|nr:hypothetical protein N0V84_000688 [Fusarium piperis]